MNEKSTKVYRTILGNTFLIMSIGITEKVTEYLMNNVEGITSAIIGCTGYLICGAILIISIMMMAKIE